MQTLLALREQYGMAETNQQQRQESMQLEKRLIPQIVQTFLAGRQRGDFFQ